MPCARKTGGRDRPLSTAAGCTTGHTGTSAGRMTVRNALLVFTGVCAFAALWKKEAEEDGTAIALSPFLGALAIEAAILLLSRKRNELVDSTRTSS